MSNFVLLFVYPCLGIGRNGRRSLPAGLCFLALPAWPYLLGAA